MRVLAITCTLAMMAGCTPAIHKSAKLGVVDTLSVDAKQRLAFSVQVPGPDGKTRTVFCAEPSPDAMSAVAYSISGNATGPNGQGSAEAAAAMQEAVSSFGRRSQTVQILRDGYYRLCEAYANGALSKEAYQHISTEVDGAIIATLAIDTLSGLTNSSQNGLVAVTPVEGLEGVEGSTNALAVVAASQVSETREFAQAYADAITEIVDRYLEHVASRRQCSSSKKQECTGEN